jgi:hypothetical protein
MNNMTNCPEGHAYDRTQHTRCPFCGLGKSLDNSTRVKKNNQVGDDEETIAATSAANSPSHRQGPSAQAGKAPEATVAVWSKTLDMDPIVGWLVCISGKNQGRDYRIRSGLNNIGRDTSNHICIAGDETITRENHCILFYDPKKANFHLTAGSGRSGVYINDDIVLQPTILQSHDKIEIGETRLVFIPFCGDKFRWANSPA